MNGNAELLNFVFQNSQMGIETIGQLKEMTEDRKFKRQLEYEYRGYRKINGAAQKALNRNGFDEKGIGAMDKAKTSLMLNMQTMTDKSSSHIAEMLILGSNMGVVNTVKNLKKYDDAEPKIKNLMEKLQCFEEDNIQQLKAFL